MSGPLCVDCSSTPVHAPWVVCDTCRALRRRAPVADVAEIERELAALVGAPEPSALRLYLTELVRDRDRWAARVRVLEQRLERMSALARGGADPLLIEVETMRAALDAARAQVT